MATKQKWVDFIALARKGDFDNISDTLPSLYVQNYAVMKRIYSDNPCKVDDIDDRCGLWYWSHQSEVGKSEAARAYTPDSYYLKGMNINWDGYKDEETVILDDLDKKHNYMGHHLKIWGDKYAFQAKILYSTLNIRPKTVIVTSNYTIAEIFPDDIEANAIRCRYKEVEFKYDKTKRKDYVPTVQSIEKVLGCKLPVSRPIPMVTINNCLDQAVTSRMTMLMGISNNSRTGDNNFEVTQAIESDPQWILECSVPGCNCTGDVTHDDGNLGDDENEMDRHDPYNPINLPPEECVFCQMWPCECMDQ